MKTQKVQSLKVTNVKAVRQFEAHFKPGLNEIAGKNEQGKSTILDSIKYAVTGKKNRGKLPLRKGEESGSIVVELNDFVFTLKFDDDDQRLRITGNGDTSKARYSQTDINDFFHIFSFDPLAFSTMDPKKQIEMVESIIPPELMKAVNDYDREIKSLEDERLYAGRDVKSMGDVTIPEKVERVDVSALSAQYSELVDRNQKIEHNNRHIVEIKERIKHLKDQLKIAEDRLQTAGSMKEPFKTDELLKAINESSVVNDQAAAYEDAVKRSKVLQEKKDLYQKLDDKLTKIRADKKDAISKIKLPVDGLTITPTGIEVDGIPWDELSSARKIIDSTKLSMAMNPNIRIMTVQNVSLLDEDNYKALVDLALENDFQLLVETVGGGVSEDAIIMEGGMIKK